METYYELQADIFAKHVPQIAEALQDEITFLGGASIPQPLPSPLIFTTGHSALEPPKGMHSRLIPVMSNSFIAALQGAGVSNLQCFSAELRSTVDGSVWKDYNAVNIIGLISCADLSASQFTHIIDRPEEDASPFLAFEDLKIDPARARDALLFRLAEDPLVILVAGSVVEYLLAQRSDDDWGITLDER